MSPKTPKIINLSSGKSYKLSKYAQTICDIVGYDYNLIKWDKDAFVGSKNKKLINTHLKGYKFTSLKKGLTNFLLLDPTNASVSHSNTNCLSIFF
jgi:nucleoside-diphosphate-sugar epimerase